MPDFYTVVTDTGLQALGLASTQGQSFSLTHAVVGDGNGLAVVPNKGMTSLVHEVWRGRVAGIKVDPKEPNTYIFEFAIPADTGGFTIREVGLMDESGKLFCIGNFPETEKPVAADGSVRDLVVRLPLHFENADVVNLVIDPAIVLATKQDVVDHNEDPQAHRLATTAQTGFVRLATDPEHIAHTRKNIAATPWGVWKLLESVMSNAYTSTSTIKIATSHAVNAVYKLFVAHTGADDPHGLVAKIKALLSSSITSSSTTTFANPKAVKTVQDNLNAHNVNAKAHRFATEDVAGFARLAKAAEHLSSTSARRNIAATPYGVWNLLTRVRSDAVNLASTWRFATSLAVKTVMDALNGHKSATDPHKSQARVDSKMNGHLGVNDPHGAVAKVKALLSSSITNASTTTFATPRAVKTVNDNLNTHKAANDPHGIVAKVKALLSSSITSTSTTTFATPKAVKLVRDLIVGHTNNAVVHVPNGGSTGDALLKSGSSARWTKLALVAVGHIDLVPFRPDALPQYFYMCNGEGLLKTSAAGKTLRAMPSAYKSDWGITENSTHIFLPNVFSGSDGYFFRAVNGSTRRVGNKQSDAIREISGTISSYDQTFDSATGAFRTSGNSSGTPTGAQGSGYADLNFYASRVVPTSHENRPKNIGMTPAIYLPAM